MTPQERAAAFIKSTFPLHLREDGEPCDGDIEDVVAHDKETRRAALLEAVQQVCMHCGRRAIGLQVGVAGPNAAGNYVHNPPEDSRLKESALCPATSIWSLIRYEDRLAQEG